MAQATGFTAEDERAGRRRKRGEERLLGAEDGSVSAAEKGSWMSKPWELFSTIDLEHPSATAHRLPWSIFRCVLTP